MTKIKVNTCYFLSKHIHLFNICDCSEENEVRRENPEELSLEFDQRSGQNFSSGGRNGKGVHSRSENTEREKQDQETSYLFSAMVLGIQLV